MSAPEQRPGAPNAPAVIPGSGESRAVVPFRSPRPPALREFQPDAIEIEEQDPPRLARITLCIVLAFIVIAVTWASLSKVNTVIVAPGELITTTPHLVVQPLETSVIRTIDVSAGDVVHAGDTLGTLDSTFAQADVEQLRLRQASYAAQIARLRAEITGQAYVAPPAATDDERLQAALYRQRHASQTAQIHNYDAQIARIEANIATGLADQKILAARLDTLQEVEGMRATLLAKEVGSRLNLLDARNARLETEMSLAHLRNESIELAHELEGTRAERQALVAEFERKTLEELTKIRTEYEAVTEELNKAKLRRKLVLLKAPADAVVLEVAKRSVGSVVREAEPLFTLVPLNVPLEAEVSIKTRDIGLAEPGQEVRIKLDAFPFQRHGTATGIVRTISRDAFATDQEKGGMPFYRARIRLTDSRLRDVPPSFRLIPGMTLIAEINVGERRVISYFLYPLFRSLDESIREP